MSSVLRFQSRLVRWFFSTEVVHSLKHVDPSFKHMNQQLNFLKRFCSTEAGKLKNEGNENQELPLEDNEMLKNEEPTIKEQKPEEIKTEEKIDINNILKTLKEKDNKLEELQTKVEETHEKLLRSYADMENLRVRSVKQAEQTKKFAVQDFAEKLLDIADNLDRAVESVPKEYREASKENREFTDLKKVGNVLDGLLAGVVLTQEVFQKILKAYGIEKYDPLNKPFDPNLHTALFEIPDSEREPGTVGDVMICGYKMHERVIRPAEVGVVKKEEDDDFQES